jgi:hypothetical protein
MRACASAIADTVPTVSNTTNAVVLAGNFLLPENDFGEDFGTMLGSIDC